MRPYLEVEVVKAKKPHTKVIEFTDKEYVVFIKDGKVSIERHKHQAESKGNFVNGENLDKIEFPCFCSYISGIGKRYCELDVLNSNDFKSRVRELKQSKEKETYSRAEFYDQDLGKLIRFLNLKILKGKIILFEKE